MKLIIKDGKIAATATDAYTGPETFIDAPEDFDISRMGDYRYEDGELVLSVPQQVTMRQARLALLAAGMLQAVAAAFDSIEDETAKQAAMIEWEYASTVERGAEWVANMAAALDLDDVALDALFIEASRL